MRITTTTGLAVAALLRAKMRSLLTTLGVVIGVAAVIIMQSMGTGATALVTGELSGLGSNMLMMIPGSAHGMGGPNRSAPLFTPADLEAIHRECPAVRYAASSNGRSARVVVGERNRSTNLLGTTAEYFDIRQWGTELGRTLSDDDQRQAAKVCVIGETIRNELFGAGVDPVGAEMRVHETSCRVIGVLEAKGASTFGQDQDDLVLMPASTFARRIMGDDKIGVVMLSAVSEDRIDEAKAQVESLMRQRRRILEGEEDDFTVRDMRELIALMGTVTGVLTSLLAGVAAVSLLVGGIGIMNIMLVSVTERTREIGIRLAVGARARDILAQFLVEAVVLSLLGGILGLLIGAGGSYAASRMLGIPFTLPPMAALLAVIVSVVVGVVFGVFPARKAAHLHPIEALRFE
ncbi:MAG: ABC transporter permease [Myxococcales bacterium]|nr:ABC transporter permease [Myxococcales bacterium]MCB9714566.1 ABC transporter permease [Myxococcales bacterium]